MAEDCAAIKSRLDAARDAYDRLVKGGAIRVVADSDGSRVEYTAANAGKLFAYIGLLQAQYDACLAGLPASLTRPLSYLF